MKFWLLHIKLVDKRESYSLCHQSPFFINFCLCSNKYIRNIIFKKIHDANHLYIDFQTLKNESAEKQITCSAGTARLSWLVKRTEQARLTMWFVNDTS